MVTGGGSDLGIRLSNVRCVCTVSVFDNLILCPVLRVTSVILGAQLSTYPMHKIKIMLC